MQNKSVMKAAAYVAALVGAVVLVLAGLSGWLENRNAELVAKTYPYSHHTHGWDVRDHGMAALQETTKNGEIVFIGSSELNSAVPQIPRNMFPNSLYPRDAVCVGKAYLQNYLAGMLLGANEEALQDNDIVLIESMQWYEGLEPDPDGFMANFSELQFYRFLHNPRISRENREYLCRRYLEMYRSSHMHWENMDKLIQKLEQKGAGEGLIKVLRSFQDRVRSLGWAVLDGDAVYAQSYLLARLYLGDSLPERAAYQLLRPYYFVRGKFLELKDRFTLYNALKDLPEGKPADPVKIDWEEIYAQAEKQGEESCTNNDLYVYDEYYTNILSAQLEKMKNAHAEEPLMVSSEWRDFDFLLSVCKDLGLEPYVVLMAAHGPYYDYVGIDRDRRAQLYGQIESMCDEYGISWFSMEDREYEPYVYCDVMHLGWKGWPCVEESVIRHFTE